MATTFCLVKGENRKQTFQTLAHSFRAEDKKVYKVGASTVLWQLVSLGATRASLKAIKRCGDLGVVSGKKRLKL